MYRCKRHSARIIVSSVLGSATGETKDDALAYYVETHKTLLVCICFVGRSIDLLLSGYTWTTVFTDNRHCITKLTTLCWQMVSVPLHRSLSFTFETLLYVPLLLFFLVYLHPSPIINLSP